MSSERSEARRKLRECTGLVDSLMYVVQSQIDCKDVDNKASATVFDATAFADASADEMTCCLCVPADRELRVLAEEPVISRAP